MARGRGSLVELRELRQIKLLQSAHLCWRDTTLMQAWKLHGVLATHEAPPLPPSSSASIGRMWVGKVRIKQCGIM